MRHKNKQINNWHLYWSLEIREIMMGSRGERWGQQEGGQSKQEQSETKESELEKRGGKWVTYLTGGGVCDPTDYALDTLNPHFQLHPGHHPSIFLDKMWIRY